MWPFPPRPGTGDGAVSDRRPPSLRRKILVTAFILFHFGCVLAWVFPGAPSVRRFLLSRTVPFPVRRPDPATDATAWRLEPRPIVASYLAKTGQWQHWNLFAPNPMPFMIHLRGRVTYRAGNWEEWTLPRVEELGTLRAHLESRYREYQYGVMESIPALQDLARFLARLRNDPANPAVRVELYARHLNIPRHDRPELRAPGAPRIVDYARLLRDESLPVNVPILTYEVRPEDLR